MPPFTLTITRLQNVLVKKPMMAIVCALALAQVTTPVTAIAASITPGTSSAPIVAQAQSGQRINLAEAFFIQRNKRTGHIELLGSAIIWALLATSAGSLGLLGALIRANRRPDILPPETVVEVRMALRQGDAQIAIERLENDSSFFSLVTKAALAEAPHGHDAMLRAMERAAEEHTVTRLRRVETLNIIGAVAPMVGLFGTVYGMILAFEEIVASGGSPDPVGLAGGIGTALTTTFWGLVVAIPALAGYAFVRNSIDALTSEAALVIEELLNRFKPAPGSDRSGAVSSEAPLHADVAT